MSKKGKIVILVGILLIIILALIFIFGKKPRNDDNTPDVGGQLEIWGVVDSPSNVAGFISEIIELTGAVLKYRQIPESEYEQILLDALAADEGPDIFAIHSTWLGRHANKLMPVSPELINLREFQDLFVDVVGQDLVAEGRIFALPFYIDTLGLFYNRDIFNSAGIALPPKTWEEFVNISKALTLLDSQGKIIRSGAALGTADNVNFAAEILQILMMQGGTQMVEPTLNTVNFNRPVFAGNQQITPGLTALEFYTDFANPAKDVYSWNDQQPNSIEAFAQGRVVMALNFSSVIEDLKERAPQLRFSVATLPKISPSDTSIAYPSYWAFGVNRRSKHTVAAWQVLLTAAKSTAAEVYLKDTGRVSARRDVLVKQINDPTLGPFAQQALSARSWPQIDEQAIDEIFRNMINLVVRGQDKAKNALKAAAEQVTALMEK